MNLVSVFSYTQFCSSLLVQEPCHGVVKYFSFPRRQRPPPCKQGRPFDPLTAIFQVLGQSEFDGGHQMGVINWFNYKIDCSILHGAHHRNGIAV
jgi:hypothetical protein